MQICEKITSLFSQIMLNFCIKPPHMAENKINSDKFRQLSIFPPFSWSDINSLCRVESGKGGKIHGLVLSHHGCMVEIIKVYAIFLTSGHWHTSMLVSAEASCS